MATSYCASRYTMVLDGCFGTQLSHMEKDHEIADRKSQLQFNTSKPDLVKSVHTEFLKAGANVIRTNTYWASELFMTNVLNLSVEDSKKLITDSVNIVKDAIHEHTVKEHIPREKYKIAGSCGSVTNTKAISIDNLYVDALKNIHRLRAETLLDAGVDFLVFESIETRMEADAIIQLLRELREGTCAWMTLRLDSFITENIDDIYHLVQDCYADSANITAMGVNCVSPTNLIHFVKKINEMVWPKDIQLVLCPKKDNDLKPSDKWQPFPISADFCASQWRYSGIKYIGGCCNVLPHDIRAIRTAINNASSISQFQF